MVRSYGYRKLPGEHPGVDVGRIPDGSMGCTGRYLPVGGPLYLRHLETIEQSSKIIDN